jgi:thiamine-monophosphate kinase
VGGDTIAHGSGLVLSVSAVGLPCQGGPVTRAGARPGDLIAVTGALGGSIHGRHLRFDPRLQESEAVCRLGPPSAMMDLSDGLLKDLFRMCDLSGTGFVVDAERVPVHADARLEGPGAADPVLRALGDGEDFELLFTAAPAVMRRILDNWSLPTPISVVGEIRSESRTLRRAGRESEARPLGYDHG